MKSQPISNAEYTALVNRRAAGERIPDQAFKDMAATDYKRMLQDISQKLRDKMAADHTPRRFTQGTSEGLQAAISILCATIYGHWARNEVHCEQLLDHIEALNKRIVDLEALLPKPAGDAKPRRRVRANKREMVL